MAKNGPTILSTRHSDTKQFTLVRLPPDLYAAIKILALEWDCSYIQVIHRLVEQEQREQRVRDYLHRRSRREQRHTYTQGQSAALARKV